MSAVRSQNVAISLTGDFETAKALDALPTAIQNKVVKKALRASANYVKKTARRRAPKATGLLRRKLKARVVRKGSKGNKFPKGVFGMGVYSGLPGKKMNTGDAFYGAFVEKGTKERETKDGESRGRIEGDPWLAPSLLKNKRKIKATFVRALRQAIKELPPPKPRKIKFKSGIQIK